MTNVATPINIKSAPSIMMMMICGEDDRRAKGLGLQLPLFMESNKAIASHNVRAKANQWIMERNQPRGGDDRCCSARYTVQDAFASVCLGSLVIITLSLTYFLFLHHSCQFQSIHDRLTWCGRTKLKPNLGKIDRSLCCNT